MAIQSSQHTTPSSDAELSVWLRDGWRVVLKHFPALVLIALVADVPLTFITRATERIDNGFLSTLVTMSTIAIITPVAKAAAIVAVDRWERGEPGAVASSFQALARRLHLLLTASLLWCIGVFIGVGFFVVPGVVVLVLGQCLMGAIILEGCSIKEAARRSWSLVRPRFFLVLALFGIVQVVAGIASGILETVIGLVIDGAPLDIITRALTSPIAFAPLAVMFLRSREIDDRVTATDQGIPRPTSTG